MQTTGQNSGFICIYNSGSRGWYNIPDWPDCESFRKSQYSYDSYQTNVILL